MIGLRLEAVDDTGAPTATLVLGPVASVAFAHDRLVAFYEDGVAADETTFSDAGVTCAGRTWVRLVLFPWPDGVEDGGS